MCEQLKFMSLFQKINTEFIVNLRDAVIPNILEWMTSLNYVTVNDKHWRTDQTLNQSLFFVSIWYMSIQMRLS